MDSIAFAIFSLLVVYVCYWIIKNDDYDSTIGDQRFDVSKERARNSNNDQSET